MPKKEFVFLSGRRSKDFTEKVCQSLTKNRTDLEVRTVDVVVDNFKNGEINIKLLDSIRGDDVVLVQQFAQPGAGMHQDLFELFLLLDTVSRSAAKSIILCVPFLPYLRQDRKAEGREPISAKVLLELLKKSGSGKLSRIITFDMHNSAEQGFVDIPIDDIPTMPLLAQQVFKQKWFDPKNTVVLAPDVGSAKKAEKLDLFLGLADGVAIVNKERKKGQRAVAKSIIGDVDGKNVVMIDDMIDSGGTIIGAIDLARQHNAKNILVLATHGIFSGGALEEFPEKDVQVIVTDSIPREEGYVGEKSWLDSVSVADYLSDVIYANSMGHSVREVIAKL